MYKISVSLNMNVRNVGSLILHQVVDFESCQAFVYRASSGILKQRNDSKYEKACFHVSVIFVFYCRKWQCLSMYRHLMKKFLFVAMLYYVSFIGTLYPPELFDRILRSAQIHNASLKPAYPGNLTACTCGYIFQPLLMLRNIPHYEYCPMHDIYDSEKSCMFILFCVM